MELIHKKSFLILPKLNTEIQASKFQMIKAEEDFPWSGIESCVAWTYTYGACRQKFYYNLWA